MADENQTLREIVREIHTDVKYLREDFKDTKKDHEKRIRTVEKGFWGVIGTNIVGFGTGLWAWMTGH